MITSSPRIIASNVSTLEEAKIFICLENHQKNQPANLPSIIPGPEDIGLYEASQFSPQQLYPDLHLNWESWDDLKVVERTKKKMESFKKLQHSVLTLKNNKKPSTEQIRHIQAIFKNATMLNPNPLVIPFETLKLQLMSGLNQEKFEEIKKLLIKALEDIKMALVSQIRKETFPIRQASFINCIEKKLVQVEDPLKKNKIYAFCGRSHADLEHTAFPEETQKLIDFLKTTTKFAIINLN